MGGRWLTRSGGGGQGGFETWRPSGAVEIMMASIEVARASEFEVLHDKKAYARFNQRDTNACYKVLLPATNDRISSADSAPKRLRLGADTTNDRSGAFH